MNEARFMKNTAPGVVMPYNPAVMKVSPHVAECTAEGVLIGRAPVAENTMLERITELQAKFEQETLRSGRFETAAQNALAEVERLTGENQALAEENAALREKVAKLEAAAPPLSERLNAMKVAELRQLAVERGIEKPDDLKKEELIAAIIAQGEK